MFKVLVNIPELDQLPPKEGEAVLKECLSSQEFSRRTRRVRIVSFIVYVFLLLVPPWFISRPLAKTQTQAVLYTALAVLGLMIAVLVVPLYTQPKILRRLIRERLRNANKPLQATAAPPGS